MYLPHKISTTSFKCEHNLLLYKAFPCTAYSLHRSLPGAPHVKQPSLFYYQAPSVIRTTRSVKRGREKPNLDRKAEAMGSESLLQGMALVLFLSFTCLARAAEQRSTYIVHMAKSEMPSEFHPRDW